MENSERLEVLTTPSRRVGVRLQLEQTIQQMGKEMDLRMRQVPHVESAIETLKDGNCDLIALSAFDWRDFDTTGLSIVGVLPRREPTWVLVSDDKPEYLIGQPVIVCDHPLLHRQFLRARVRRLRRLQRDYQLGWPLRVSLHAQHGGNAGWP